jgi:hypothetical protein
VANEKKSPLSKLSKTVI